MDGPERSYEISGILNSSDISEAKYLDMEFDEIEDDEFQEQSLRIPIDDDADDADDLNDPLNSEQLDCEEKLIRFKATVILKDFKGQRSNEVGETFEFCGDTVEEIFEALWNVAKSFCNRALIFSITRKVQN